MNAITPRVLSNTMHAAAYGTVAALTGGAAALGVAGVAALAKEGVATLGGTGAIMLGLAVMLGAKEVVKRAPSHVIESGAQMVHVLAYLAIVQGLTALEGTEATEQDNITMGRELAVTRGRKSVVISKMILAGIAGMTAITAVAPEAAGIKKLRLLIVPMVQIVCSIKKVATDVIQQLMIIKITEALATSARQTIIPEAMSIGTTKITEAAMLIMTARAIYVITALAMQEKRNIARAYGRAVSHERAAEEAVINEGGKHVRLAAAILVTKFTGLKEEKIINLLSAVMTAECLEKITGIENRMLNWRNLNPIDRKNIKRGVCIGALAGIVAIPIAPLMAAPAIIVVGGIAAGFFSLIRR